MYKSKLQELCHQRRWGFPKYSCMKEGPDHNPHFKASVTVNQVDFDTPIVCKSSKEAHNQAAKLAFLHFTTDHDNKATEGGACMKEICSPEIHSKASGVKAGFEYQSQRKMKLQNYAKKMNLDVPVYNIERDGPAHALCFKATVTIGGCSFESPMPYRTSKEAENAAALVALMSLPSDLFQETDFHMYKNLLQELAQNEGFVLPTYKTLRYGEPHESTFLSTVEVEGENFKGNGAKSKKQAELNAAMAAYIALMERKLSRSGNFTSPDSSKDEPVKFAVASDVLCDDNLKEKIKHSSPVVSNPIVASKEQAKEIAENYQKVPASGCFSLSDKISSQEIVASPTLPDPDVKTGHTNSYASMQPLALAPKEGQSSADVLTHPGISTLSISDTETRMGSYLLCNRVRVYTCIPELDLPKGTVVLPISENKWVTVSLEFLNEIATH